LHVFRTPRAAPTGLEDGPGVTESPGPAFGAASKSQSASLAQHFPTSTARSVRSSSQSMRSSRERAALRVALELADPLGPLEVGKHQDVRWRHKGVSYLPSFRKRGNPKEHGYHRHQPTVINVAFLSLPKSISYV